MTGGTGTFGGTGGGGDPQRGVVLREMRWWDIEPVLGLEHELFPEDAWSAGMFWAELAHARGPWATRRYLVAEATAQATAESTQRPRLVGYGGLAAVSGTGDIQTVGVLPEHRGTGLGARLLAALLSAATDFECREVLLEVRVDNPRAQRLYERFGFVPVGIRRGYYQPGNVDALVMRLDNTAEPPGFAPACAPDPTAPDADGPDAPSAPPGMHGTHGIQGTDSHGIGIHR